MIIDAILCLIVIVFALVGSRRGAIKSFRGVASIGLAGYLGLYYSYGISNYMYDLFVRSIVIDKLKEAIFSGRSDEAEYVYYEYMKYASQYSHKASDIAEYVADTYLYDLFFPITEVVVGLIVFILAFVMMELILLLLTRNIRRNSVVRGVDSIAGAVIATITGVLFIVLLSDGIYIYADTFEKTSSPEFIQWVKESYIVQWSNDFTTTSNLVIRDLISKKA